MREAIYRTSSLPLETHPLQHMASNLQQSSQALSESLSDLRVALNHAQQLNFSQQLVYSEVNE